MALSTQPYKGTRDFYPEEMRRRRAVFQAIRGVIEGYGFEEYDGPMLESFELYAAKTGEEIVEKQLYHFEDRGGRRVAIRPEMTPTMARMVAARVHELPKPVRWYSWPNLWRYERPQRGRLREHWQLNLDLLGGDSVLADVEILSVAQDLLRPFGVAEQIEVRVNHRGLMDTVFATLGLTTEQAHRAAKIIDEAAKLPPDVVTERFEAAGISTDVRKRLDAFFQASLEDVLEQYACEGSAHLKAVLERVASPQVRFDPTVMRGLDYYTGLVFEIYDRSPENPRAMFGGGRYDGLVGLFGKEALSGVGFGMGDVTLMHFLETHQALPEVQEGPDVFVVMSAPETEAKELEVARMLREAGVRVVTSLAREKLGKQFKSADRHHARFVLIIGTDELKAGTTVLKELKTGQQETVAQSELMSHLKSKGVLK